MAPPKKRLLPKPLPDGFILTDTEWKPWRLGRIIGQGGFGLIYLASQDVDMAVAEDTDYVIKVEYHDNGPLFSELKFYQRAAKQESVQRWIRSKKLPFLGVPAYWGTGSAEYNGNRYRFMAMDRLGTDLHKVCQRNGGRLKKETVLHLGQGLVDVLEYIHDNEYVHGDIKGANLMLGYRHPDKVYLADYGLCYRYSPDGVHKEFKENPKKGHNGTIEYTSLDAHRGVAPSRRGDLQILGFCLLHWLCGALPWEGDLSNPGQVMEAKARLMDRLPGSVQQLSVGGATTDEVARFLLCVRSLGYQERPDYPKLQGTLGRQGHGPLDLARPPGATLGGAAPGDQKAGHAARKPAQQHSVEQPRPRPVPVHLIRGPPGNKPAAVRGAGQYREPRPTLSSDEEDVDGDVKQRGQEGLRRSSRLQTKPAAVYGEDYTSEEQEEGHAKSSPIAACYLRGPPIEPRQRPEQQPAPATQQISRPKRLLEKRQRQPMVLNGSVQRPGSDQGERDSMLAPTRGPWRGADDGGGTEGPRPQRRCGWGVTLVFCALLVGMFLCVIAAV